MDRKQISLCMIVRDEEQWLARCLASVEGIVDEMVIVDTGSVDKTVTIARDFNAKVFQEVWQHDFARMRNISLQHAEGEWILFLDADEALDPDTGPLLRQYAEQTSYSGYFLQVHNYLGHGSGRGATVNPVLRMFRNHPGYRFRGKIHEQIAEPILKVNSSAAFYLTEVKIHHMGYLKEVVQSKRKVERNMKLLSRAVHEDPEDPFHRFNWGVEYLRTGKNGPALEQFCEAKKRLDLKRSNYAHLLLKYEIRALLELGRWKEAHDASQQAIKQFPEYTDLYHYLSLCHVALGRLYAAEKAMRNALKLGPAPPGYHTEEGIGTYQTAFKLGELFEKRQKYESAVDWYIESIRSHSGSRDALCRIFCILKAIGREDDIFPLLEKVFSFRTPEALVQTILLLIHYRCFLSALALLNHHPNVLRVDRRERLKLVLRIRSGQLGHWKQLQQELNRGKNGAQSELERILVWMSYLEYSQQSQDKQPPNRIQPYMSLPEGGNQLSDDLQVIADWAFSTRRIPGMMDALADLGLRMKHETVISETWLQLAEQQLSLADDSDCHSELIVYSRIQLLTKGRAWHDDGYFSVHDHQG